MTNIKDVIKTEEGPTRTIPAYTIGIRSGKAEYLKEQLVLKNGFIREKIPYEGTPDLYVTSGFINCHMHWVMNGDATPFMEMLEEVISDPVKKVEAAIAHAQDTLKLGITFGWDKGPPGSCALPIYAGMREAEKKGAAMTRFIYSPWAIMVDGSFGNPFGRVLGSDSEMDVILMETVASSGTSIKFIPETSLKLKNKSYQFLMSNELFLNTRKKAKEKNLLFAVHAKGIDSLDKCIAAEVDCIEHGIQAANRQLKMFQEKDIYLGPTLYGLECRLELVRKSNGNTDVAGYEFEAVCDMIQRASQLNRGKPFTHMLFSSDAGSFTTPHASIRELYLMRKYGYDPVSVFEAATVNGARCTKQERMGRVQKDNAANLVYWTKNPLELSLEEWEHLENHIAAVVLEGTVAHRN
jgi:imidazolonepropionase-like amidohydrolase